MLRILANIAIFIAAFAAVGAGMRSYAPERLKIEWFQQHQDDYDLVFIGSSHVYRQLDAESIAAGLPSSTGTVQAFTFGVPGMRFAETLHMANRLLEQDCAKLKWLVLELDDLRTDMEEENLFTQRQVYWHDWFASWWVLRALMAENLATAEKTSRAKLHLHHFAHWLGNIGRGPAAWALLTTGAGESFFTASGALRPGIGENGHGWRPLDLEAGNPSYEKRRREFMADLDGFRNSRRALVSSQWTGPPAPVLAAAIDDLDKRAAARGVQLAFIILPGYEKPAGWMALKKQGHIKHLLAFNDPQRWPEFYRANNRWDLFHLNRAGSELLSQAFIEEFKPMWEEQR